ncbi:MAG: amidohydrolase, partial [Flavobacteriales bacterium]|nr:amidohydrolase [Flavobacteriales bacterium]
MKKLMSFSLMLLVLAGCNNHSDAPGERTMADMVMFNGNIYTVDKEQPVASAVAIYQGKILYVGANDTAKAFIGDSTRVIDLQGKTMTPGFIEGHG